MPHSHVTRGDSSLISSSKGWLAFPAHYLWKKESHVNGVSGSLHFRPPYSCRIYVVLCQSTYIFIIFLPCWSLIYLLFFLSQTLEWSRLSSRFCYVTRLSFKKWFSPPASQVLGLQAWPHTQQRTLCAAVPTSGLRVDSLYPFPLGSPRSPCSHSCAA